MPTRRNMSTARRRFSARLAPARYWTSIAWVAIEPADAPWPKIPGKDYTAGPFNIVWTGSGVAAIRSEYWAYQTAKLLSELSPAARWPQIAVDPGLPADDSLRKGQALYIAQCLPCHRLNGGGASDVGPDLNLPMNPTWVTVPGVPLNTGSQIPHIDVQYRYSSVQVTSTHSLTSVKVEFSNGAQQTWSPGTTSGTFTGSGSLDEASSFVCAPPR